MPPDIREAMNETLIVVLIAAGVAAIAAVLLYRIFRSEPASERSRASATSGPTNTSEFKRAREGVRAATATVATDSGGATAYAAAEAPPEIVPQLGPALDPVRMVHAVALGLDDAAERSSPPRIAAGHEGVVTRARELLESVATQPKYAPRKPLLIPELMRAVNDSDTTRRELAAIIARDPALAGELLRLANSPMYRVSKQPVEAIERAVVLLGTEGIRSLIAVAILQPVFRVPPGRFARFPEVLWDHAARSSVAAETYAAIIDSSDPFAAQLLGLLLGLGRIITFRVMSDAYDEHPELTPDAETFAVVIESSAAALAAQIAASWGLSERITEALAEESSGNTTRESALGRALHFGQTLGALAVLHHEDLVDTDIAQALMRSQRCPDHHFDRIWQRLTRKPE